MSNYKVDRHTKVWYLRNKKDVPYAVVVGHKNKGVGWSLCMKHEQFCKKDGLRFALARMGSDPEKAPHSIREEVYRMVDYLTEGGDSVASLFTHGFYEAV